jgi:hypothetical protein
VIIVFVVRLAAAGAIVIGGPFAPSVSVLVVAATSIFLSIRSPYGTDGADQLLLIIFVAAALASIVGTTIAQGLFLWFVTLQACLAYAIAGVAKLWSPAWRRGDALPGILGTSNYGDRRFGPLLSRHPVACRWLGWSVIALECSFPLVLLGIPLVTYSLVGALATFHVGALFLMRLNTFLWAFAATYPSVIFCSLHFRGIAPA